MVDPPSLETGEDHQAEFLLKFLHIMERKLRNITEAEATARVLLFVLQTAIM